MAILEAVTCGKFSSPESFVADAEKGNFIEREIFTFERFPFSVAVITDYQEIGSFELDADLLSIEVSDKLQNPARRERVFVRRAHLVNQFFLQQPFGQITRTMDPISSIKANQSLIFSMQALKAALGRLKQKKSIDLWKNFSIGDADKIASFIRENLPSWEGPQGGWRRSNGMLVRWYRAKKEGKERLPRSLIVCKTESVVSSIFILFNQKFPKCHPKGVYEGLLGKGVDNRVKCALELFSGQFYAVRIAKNPDAIERAEREEEFLERLPSECVIQSLIFGRYRGKGLQTKFMSIKPMFFCDLSRKIPRHFDTKLEVALRVTALLDQIHKARCAHGDLKSDAIMYQEGFQEIKLSDLRVLPLNEGPPLDREGTPQYIYPFSVRLETPLTDDRWGLGIVLWSLFQMKFMCTDGNELDYEKYLNKVTSIRPQYFTEEDNDYKGFCKAVSAKLRRRWISEPQVGTIDHVVWSLLRSDLSKEEETTFLATDVLPALHALRARPMRVPYVLSSPKEGEEVSAKKS